jgi:hypothetical protein
VTAATRSNATPAGEAGEAKWNLPSPLPPAPSSVARSVPPPAAPEDPVATRMIDLAKAALLKGDGPALDRWTEGLRAAGEHDRLAARIEAIARLTRGQVGEALRALRAAWEAESETSPPALRAQASLAFGLALAAANRADEALLAGLDALARAREGRDPRATSACLAFLAKLFARAERGDEAAALRAASRRG